MNMNLISKVGVVGLLYALMCFVRGAAAQEQRTTYCDRTICSFAWSPGEGNFLAVVNDYGLWLYDANDPASKPHLIPYGHSHDVSFDSTGSIIAVAGCSNEFVVTATCMGMLSLFDITHGTWEVIAQSQYPIYNIKFSSDGMYIMFGLRGGINLINLATRERFRIYEPIYTTYVPDYAIDPFSNRVAISSGIVDGHAFFGISLWNLAHQTREAKTTIVGEASAVAFTEDGTSILFVKWDTQLSEWNLESGVIIPIGQLRDIRGDSLNRFEFSDNSLYLTGALMNGPAPYYWSPVVWELASGREVFAPDSSPKQSFDAVMINSAGNYVAYADSYNERWKLYVWERETGETRELQFAP